MIEIRTGAADAAGAGGALVAAVALAATLLPLNSTMIAVALPAIASDVGGGAAASSWMITGYVLAMAVLGPLAGLLGDRHGRRRMLLVGLLAFAAASAASALVDSLGLLVAARLLQAAAGSLVVPNAMAILRAELPAGRRATGFGVVSSVIGVAAVVAPAVGGLLVESAGWRAVFLVNLPLALAAVALALHTIPSGGAGTANAVRTCVRCALRRVAVPEFVAAAGAMALGNVAMYAVLIGTPMVLAHDNGWSSGDAGLALALMSAAMVAVSPFAGRLADARGRRAPAVTGLVAVSAAMLVLAVMGSTPGAAGLAAALAVAGAGLGLAGAALQAAAVDVVAAADAGVASGLFATARYAGGLVAALLVAAMLGDDGAGAEVLFAVAAATGVAGVLLSLGLAGARVGADVVPAPQ